MTRTFRTALTAVLLLGLLAGGAGAAAAEQCVENTVVVNDDDVVDLDDSLNNITANVLGVQNDDSPLTILFDGNSVATSQMY